ncbi:S1 family peptidase [Labrys wisconsinensis]|uniref:Secreted trypsin-like serine protease n=1 Tax=Labrys wisconsinensis TaxID=425677 RepID=A0ABU0J8Z0_9HYPH|nr:trypsin-like serine protease [Labrys wisconsinensis]MDQ0469724.1 secreted trypsin-like serine protease [Labrys wisconsinensis]
MSIRLRSALALAALLAATVPALAIKGGAASSDPAGIRRSVVQIKGPGGTQCTGTVVSRRLVLTAAHCFLAGRGDYKIRALNPDFRFRFAMGVQVAVHPEFDVRALGTGAPLNDIALLRSDRDFPNWLTPVTLAASVPNDNQFVDVLAAGFGMNRDRRIASAGTLREMHFAMLDKVYDPSKQLFLIDREGKLKARSARTGICRGDSGGPVFRRTASGTVLVGVISAVIAGRGYDCGAITAVTAVPAYRSYIQEMANKAGSTVVFR